MKHPTTIVGYTDSMQDIANEIASLRYDKLHEFMTAFAVRVAADAAKDKEAGKEKLAGALQCMAGCLYEAMTYANEASAICKPFNK